MPHKNNKFQSKTRNFNNKGKGFSANSSKPTRRKDNENHSKPSRGGARRSRGGNSATSPARGGDRRTGGGRSSYGGGAGARGGYSNRSRDDENFSARSSRPAARRPYDDDRAPRGRGKSFDKEGPRHEGKSFDRRSTAGSKPPSRSKSFDRNSSNSGRDWKDERRPSASARGGDARKTASRSDTYQPKRSSEKTFPSKTYQRTSAPTGAKAKGTLEMGEKRNYGAPSPMFLYGVHASSAAWVNPQRKIARLLVTEAGLAHLAPAIAEAKNLGLKRPEPKMVEKEDLDKLLPKDSVHQGILVDAEPLEETFLQDILITAKDDAIVLILDQVTDPHNVGAILRSASAFGAVAVVVQKLHAPEITGTLAKIASGAAEHVPLVREVNLSRAIDLLKKEGFFCIGLDEDGKEPLAQCVQTGKVALVLGAEGDGLRRLVGESCDLLANLPTQGPIGSLNVSNAAAISLYEVIRARATV